MSKILKTLFKNLKMYNTYKQQYVNHQILSYSVQGHTNLNDPKTWFVYCNSLNQYKIRII